MALPVVIGGHPKGDLEKSIFENVRKSVFLFGGSMVPVTHKCSPIKEFSRYWHVGRCIRSEAPHGKRPIEPNGTKNNDHGKGTRKLFLFSCPRTTIYFRRVLGGRGRGFTCRQEAPRQASRKTQPFSAARPPASARPSRASTGNAGVHVFKG